MVNGVTSLAAGELLPHVVYYYRRHPHSLSSSACLSAKVHAASPG